jgi:hypothetical protein
MSDTARDYQKPTSPDTNGLDDLFAQGLLNEPKESSISNEGLLAKDSGVLPEIAATHLGLSVSGVLKRLRKGDLPGFKVPSKRGEKWLVCSTALPGGVLKDSLLKDEGLLEIAKDSSINAEGVLETGKDSSVKNEDSLVLIDAREWETSLNLEQELVPQSTGNVDVSELLRKLEGATYRIGWLESQLQEREREIKLLTDNQHKPGWWAKFSTWFFKIQ